MSRRVSNWQIVEFTLESGAAFGEFLKRKEWMMDRKCFNLDDHDGPLPLSKRWQRAAPRSQLN